MKAESKFNVKDKFWVIHKSKALELEVFQVKILIEEKIEITYVAKVPKESKPGDFDFEYFSEQYTFNSREELIGSL